MSLKYGACIPNRIIWTWSHVCVLRIYRRRFKAAGWCWSHSVTPMIIVENNSAAFHFHSAVLRPFLVKLNSSDCDLRFNSRSELDQETGSSVGHGHSPASTSNVQIERYYLKCKLFIFSSAAHLNKHFGKWVRVACWLIFNRSP